MLQYSPFLAASNMAYMSVWCRAWCGGLCESADRAGGAAQECWRWGGTWPGYTGTAGSPPSSESRLPVGQLVGAGYLQSYIHLASPILSLKRDHQYSKESYCPAFVPTFGLPYRANLIASTHYTLVKLSCQWWVLKYFVFLDAVKRWSIRYQVAKQIM